MSQSSKNWWLQLCIPFRREGPGRWQNFTTTRPGYRKCFLDILTVRIFWSGCWINSNNCFDKTSAKLSKAAECARLGTWIVMEARSGELALTSVTGLMFLSYIRKLVSTVTAARKLWRTIGLQSSKSWHAHMAAPQSDCSVLQLFVALPGWCFQLIHLCHRLQDLEKSPHFSVRKTHTGDPYFRNISIGRILGWGNPKICTPGGDDRGWGGLVVGLGPFLVDLFWHQNTKYSPQKSSIQCDVLLSFKTFYNCLYLFMFI